MPRKSKIVQELTRFGGRHGDAAVIPDLVNTGEAHTGGQLIGVKVAPVSRECFWRLGLEDDPAFAALQVPAAVVVKVDSVPVKDLQE